MVYSSSMINTGTALIGGQALRALGHDRHTDDVDFFVNVPGQALFTHEDEGDLVNAAAHNFLSDVWAAMTIDENGVADPQTLGELKAWSFIQHCQNMNWKKVAATEYDMMFLAREFGVTEFPILAKFAHAGEMTEIARVVARAKK